MRAMSPPAGIARALTGLAEAIDPPAPTEQMRKHVLRAVRRASAGAPVDLGRDRDDLA